MACVVFTAILLPATIADTNPGATGQQGYIQGRVLDSFGTGVPGAEVRLMTLDGRWCQIPDNPVLSSANDEVGAFEFKNLSPRDYLICAVKNDYTGSISLCTAGGKNYAEITLPGYTCVPPAQSISPPLPEARAVIVTPVPSAVIKKPAPAETNYALPDIWRAALAGIAVLAGVLLAMAVLKRQ